MDGAGGILVTRDSLASFPDYFVNPWVKMFPLWNKGNLVQKKLAAGAPHDPPPLATAHHLGRVMGLAIHKMFNGTTPAWFQFEAAV